MGSVPKHLGPQYITYQMCLNCSMGQWIQTGLLTHCFISWTVAVDLVFMTHQSVCDMNLPEGGLHP